MYRVLIRLSMCDLRLNIYACIYQLNLRQRQHITALTCISSLCTGLAHVRTDLRVLCGNGLSHWHKPLHRQTHRLPHPDQGLCGFLCYSGSLLVVYQRCYLLIQDTTDCNRDFPFWDRHMYMYIIFMFSYISQLEKKACYIHKSFKKYYVLHVYTYVYCHCMYRLCIQWLIYWQKHTSLTAPRAICTCRATWERQEFNSDKEINNKIKIHQYKTQHRFTTHKENL